MSSEHLVYDVEKGSKTEGKPDSPHKEGPWKWLSICSFLLLIGAVAVFAVLQFRASENQDPEKHGHSLPVELPRVQALSPRRPAIHAVASRSHGETLKWTTAVVPAMEKGMTLDEKNNVLVVPSSGLYFVYSQLLFHKDSCPTDVPLLLTHTISILKSKEFLTDEVPLLKSIKSVCEGETSSPNRMWFESIYQGAIFQLTRGDRLTSKTAETQYLDFTREGQLYFGAIALE